MVDGGTSRTNWASPVASPDDDALRIDADKRDRLVNGGGNRGANNGRGGGWFPWKRIAMIVGAVVAVIAVVLCFIASRSSDTDTDSTNASTLSLTDDDVTAIRDLGKNFLVKDGNFGVLRLNDLIESQSFGMIMYNTYTKWIQQDIREAFPSEYESWVLPRLVVVEELSTADGGTPAMLASDSPLAVLRKQYEAEEVAYMKKYSLDGNTVQIGDIPTSNVRTTNAGDMTVDVDVKFTSVVTQTSRQPAAYDDEGNIAEDDYCSQGGGAGCPVTQDSSMRLDPKTSTTSYDMNVTITFVKTNNTTWQVQNISGGNWEENGWVLATAPVPSTDNSTSVTITPDNTDA